MKMNAWRYAVYGMVIILLVAIATATMPAASSALPALTATLPSPDLAHLPIIRYDASPTPAPTPTDSPYSAAAVLAITPSTHLQASTYNTGSFRLENISLDDVLLVELRIDLSTAILPDMVFDPFGVAGDKVAKDVTVDRAESLSLDGHAYEGPHDGGFNVLILNFHNFNRGEQFWFSVDVDPTSIAGVGAPGPGEAGSVGGLELIGTTVTATFDDGTVLTNEVARLDDPGNGGRTHSGAVAVLRPGLPGRPAVAVSGIAGPAAVSSAQQTVRVTGPIGRPFVLLVIERVHLTAGVLNAGFDLDPFESNTAVDVREYRGNLGVGGAADVPIVLTRSVPEGGINTITAFLDNHYGVSGLVAEPLVLQLE